MNIERKEVQLYCDFEAGYSDWTQPLPNMDPTGFGSSTLAVKQLWCYRRTPVGRFHRGKED